MYVGCYSGKLNLKLTSFAQFLFKELAMMGFKLITTGLNENIHSVIGFELHTSSGIEKMYIQPKDDTRYDYEAMKEINNLSIQELKTIGKDRADTLNKLVDLLSADETILVWYYPFIGAFLASIMDEIGEKPRQFIVLDLLSVAKEKNYAFANYKLQTVMDELKCNSLLELFESLTMLQEKDKVRRL